MTDFSTRFAFAIDLDGYPDWADELDALCRGFDAAGIDVPDDHPFADPARQEFGLPDIEWTCEGLLISDFAGQSDLGVTVRVLQWILNRPGTPDSVTFEFANTCSAVVDGGFGGGVIKVTPDAYARIHTSDEGMEELLDSLMATNQVLAAELPAAGEWHDLQIDRADPTALAEAAREVIRYAWVDERNDYLEQDDAAAENHVFRRLVQLRDALGLHDELEGDLDRRGTAQQTLDRMTARQAPTASDAGPAEAGL